MPTMNIAATIPNSATNAGNSIDCDRAAENGSRRNSGSCNAVAWPGGRAAAPGISALIRDVMNAAMPALPSTEPTCRVALYTPEPAPASCGGRLRVAVAANGAQMNAIPTPRNRNGSNSRQIGVAGAIAQDSHVTPIASTENPNPITALGWARSTILPTNGASAPDITAIGAVSNAERVGVSPLTTCA